MEWISVKDRLPEENGDYLVFCATQYDTSITVGVFVEVETPEYQWSCGPVTHWMPLPSPPEE